MGDPWGDLNAPEDTSEQKLPLLYVTPDKKNKNFRITYAQNHFKSTFGSAYLISKKNDVKTS